jgi:hypothetical protein
VTEREWLEFVDLVVMLAFLRGKASDRKLRLLACACWRRIWPHVCKGEGRHVVEVAERFADGQATAAELFEAYDPD